ncbi:MAG: hypothetical protein KAW02_05220 [candidate division Zixibacteria bacterium]|nr:hypothetical protein [candidate division Zixibacteria bacterium]
MNGIAHTAGQLKKMKNSHPQVQHVQQVRRDPAFGGVRITHRISPAQSGFPPCYDKLMHSSSPLDLLDPFNPLNLS